MECATPGNTNLLCGEVIKLTDRSSCHRLNTIPAETAETPLRK